MQNTSALDLQREADKLYENIKGLVQNGWVTDPHMMIEEFIRSSWKVKYRMAIMRGDWDIIWKV